jgi:predicted ATPase
LVGRDEEIDLLLRRWTRAKAGDGQVVLISGEPGLGKSRLTAALIEYLHRESRIQLRYFCSPYHQDTALFPFIHQLARAVGFAPDDAPATKRDKLEALLSRVPPPKEDLALLADLLSLPVRSGDGADTGGVDPAPRRSGPPTASDHGFRGRALDRSYLAGTP